jgi:hypothetical protein
MGPLPMEMRRCFAWLRSNHNAVIAVFTVGIFVVSAIYALVATLQWCTMRGQLGEMQAGGRQTDRQLIVIEGATRATVGADVVIDWKSVRHQQGTHRLRLVLKLANKGKTAAEHVCVAANIGFQTPEHKDYTFTNSDSDFASTDIFTLQPPTFSSGLPRAARDSIGFRTDIRRPYTIADAQGGFVYIWGKYRYKDLLNTLIVKPFCFQAPAKSVFASPEGDADPGYDGPFDECIQREETEPPVPFSNESICSLRDPHDRQ